MTEKEIELTQKLEGLLSGLGINPECIDSAIKNFNPSIFQELGETLTFGSDVNVDIDEDGELCMSWETDNECYGIPEGLNLYEEGGDNVWVDITQIIVPTEYDKDQLLKAFEYIHNLRGINSDYIAVGTIMHMYQHPDRIKVNPFKVAK